MASRRVTCHLRAVRSRVCGALLDATAVQRRTVPDQMTSRVRAFDPRESGRFRGSLAYDTLTGVGKTDRQTDTFDGRFIALVPDTTVVQTVEFDTADPAMVGAMTITYEFRDADGGTDVVAVHENLPPGVRPADNELGWSMSLAKLAALLEGDTAIADPRFAIKPVAP